MLRAAKNSLLSLIYPLECRVCTGPVDNTDDGAACGDCWDATRTFHGSEMLCNKCGAFFGEDAAAPVAVFCHKCDDHFYDKAIAVGVYEKALAASIIEMKTVPNFSKRVRSAVMIALRRIDMSNIDLIIPVPLSKRRSVERGFNQANIIANLVGTPYGIPVDTLSLTRRVHTPMHRIGMDQKARELTVEKTFEVVRPTLVARKNILLIDDVFTSGATSSRCAQVLKKSGSGKVNVFTLARAVMR